MLSKRNHYIKSLYAEMSSCNISDITSLIVTKATKHSIHLYLKCWIPLINNGISYKKCSIGTSTFSRYKRLKSVVQQKVLCFAKKGFPLSISSVNATKFGHIYWRNLQWKTSFFVQCCFFITTRVIIKMLVNMYVTTTSFSRNSILLKITLISQEFLERDTWKD